MTHGIPMYLEPSTACIDCPVLVLAVNEGTASFMEYKCINASFPEMSGQALFQRATSPDGQFPSNSSVKI